MTPEDRIDDLEFRLVRYNAWMKESIEQRDRLALDAAWGVHYALHSGLLTVVAVAAIFYFLGASGWVSTILLFAALMGIPFAVHIWSNGLRMKEVEQLSKLPEWEWGG